MPCIEPWTVHSEAWLLYQLRSLNILIINMSSFLSSSRQSSKLLLFHKLCCFEHVASPCQENRWLCIFYFEVGHSRLLLLNCDFTILVGSLTRVLHVLVESATFSNWPSVMLWLHPPKQIMCYLQCFVNKNKYLHPRSLLHRNLMFVMWTFC